MATIRSPMPNGINDSARTIIAQMVAKMARASASLKPGPLDPSDVDAMSPNWVHEAPIVSSVPSTAKPAPALPAAPARLPLMAAPTGPLRASNPPNTATTLTILAVTSKEPTTFSATLRSASQLSSWFLAQTTLAMPTARLATRTAPVAPPRILAPRAFLASKSGPTLSTATPMMPDGGVRDCATSSSSLMAMPNSAISRTLAISFTDSAEALPSPASASLGNRSLESNSMVRSLPVLQAT